MNIMRVLKRNGNGEEVSFDKIKTRINKLQLMEPNLNNIDIIKITQKVIAHLFDNIKTEKIDEISANICSSLVTEHPEYVILGSRIIISNNQIQYHVMHFNIHIMILNTYDVR